MAPEQEARLDEVVDHSGETWSLFLRLGGPLVFRPGQFISCLLPVGGETIIRPYSIASDPEDATRLEILLNRVPGGAGSEYLLARRVGDVLRFTGPWGTFTLDRAPDDETVFIADGTGIAPIRPMIRRALATGGGRLLHLVHGVVPGAPAVYRGEMTAHAALRAEWVPRTALEEVVQRRWIDADEKRGRHFFICGIGAIVTSLRDHLRSAGYARRSVQYEKW